MQTTFSDVSISSVVSVVPSRKVRFAEEVATYSFSPAKTVQLGAVLGLDERRLAWEEECTSDYFHYGTDYLVKSGTLRLDEVGAVVVVTQTPDQAIPPTSSMIHGRLGLGVETVCMDINSGCCGYIYGLLQSFMLCMQGDIAKVLLLCGDTLSRQCSPQDRNIYPLIGDAGSVTVVERTPGAGVTRIALRNDGSRADLLEIPAGGSRRPSTEETRTVVAMPDGNKRSLEQFHMNGSGVFLFTQTDVPKLIEDMFEVSGEARENIDSYLFHQPNSFVLKKLAAKLGIDMSLLPSDVVGRYGNSSSATIPMALCQSLATRVKSEKLRVCMAGFGVGLAWGVALLDLGPLQSCALLEKPRGVTLWNGEII